MTIPQPGPGGSPRGSGPSTSPYNPHGNQHPAAGPQQQQQTAAVTWSPLSIEDEARRKKTVDFLARLARDGSANDTRTTDNDELSERCWFSCQMRVDERCVGQVMHAGLGIRDGLTLLPALVRGAGRRKRREADCSVACYIQTKDRKGKQRSVDIGDPGDALSNQESCSLPLWARPPTTPELKGEPKDTRYRFSTLEGKYIYRARGTYALAKYAAPDMNLEALYDLEHLQESTPPATITRAEKLGLARRTPLVPPTNYEKLYPLCTMLSSRLQRFHDHLVRIYSPAFGALAKMPTMLSDGTYVRISKELWDHGISGDGLVLGRRLLATGAEQAKKWWEKGSGGGGGSSAPRGNGDPPAPSASPPAPPARPGSAEPAV